MPRCKGRNSNGEPCGAPERLVDPHTGFCGPHGPDSEKFLSKAGRLGGAATARKFRAPGLREGELGDLETHEDAQRWLKIIGEAVTTGRLSHNEANACTRAVAEWVKAHGEQAGSTTVKELEKEVIRLKDDLREQGALTRDLRKRLERDEATARRSRTGDRGSHAVRGGRPGPVAASGAAT